MGQLVRSRYNNESFQQATWVPFLPIMMKGDMLVECWVVLNNLVPTCMVRKEEGLALGWAGGIVIKGVLEKSVAG